VHNVGCVGMAPLAPLASAYRTATIYLYPIHTDQGRHVTPLHDSSESKAKPR